MHRPVRIDPRRARVRLDVALMLARSAEGVLEDPMRRLECRFSVRVGPDGHDKLALHVGMRHRRPFAAEVGVLMRLWVQYWRAFGKRVVGRGKRRQLFVVHLDELGGFLSCMAGFRGNRGHPIADEADPVASEHWPVLDAPTEASMLGQISASQDGVNARKRSGGLGVDRADTRVCIRAAHVNHVQHAWLAHVGGVARPASYLQLTFDAILGLRQRLENCGVDAAYASALMNRPYVLINVAASVDGKIDTAERRGAAISSESDRERVDRLRASVDAVMVGGRTLHDEDPRLTVKSAALRAERLARGEPENPAKVAVTSRLDLRREARFLTSGPARIILFVPRGAAALTSAEVYELGERRVDLIAAMDKLHQIGIRRLLVEGGGSLNFELLRLGLVDEVQIYLAPLIFGGASTPTLADGDGLTRERAIRLQRTTIESHADGGVLVRYKVLEPSRE